MKKIRIFPLLMIFCLLLGAAAPSAYALEDPEVAAEAVVVADLDTGRIIYSRNMDQQRSPASLTKIMTILLTVEAIENGSLTLDEMVTAQQDCRHDLDDDSSTSYIYPGEILSMKDLMYCAMLSSANEACNILSEHISGSISAFVEIMNARAAELGMNNTHFVDPNGLSAEDYTTAHDFYLLTREAIRHELFMTVCNTADYTVPATNAGEARALANSNALIGVNGYYGDDYYYEYAAGVKTGYTRAAGYCLISTAEKDGVHLLTVVMGSTGVNNSDRSDYGNFVDALTLYNWVFDNFSYQDLITAEETVTTVHVELAEGSGNVALHPLENINLLLPNDMQDVQPDVEVTLYNEELVAPIAAGEVLGEAALSVNGVSYGSVKLVTNTSVDLSKKEYIKLRLDETFHKPWVILLIVIVLIFLLGYIALVIRYRRLRQKHLRERRRAEQRRREEMARNRRPESEPEPTQRFTAVDPGKDDGYDYDRYFNNDRK